MRFRHGTTVVAALALLVSTTPLAAQTADTAAAVRTATIAAEGWLQIVDQGQFAASWDSAATLFKGAVTREQWVQAVTQARSTTGQLGAREKPVAQYTTQLPGVQAGQYVVMQYRTTAGPGRTVAETVTAVFDGGRGWRVVGYFVRPL
jgi:hypothetical protein